MGDHDCLFLAPTMESTTIYCNISPLLHMKGQRSHVNQKQKHSIFSSMFPMRNTCTSYLQRHTRWSSQLGAMQDEAILLRGRKNFHWPQRLYFLHLHHMSSVVRSRLVQSFTPEQSQSSMCTFLLEKKGPRLAMKESLLPLLTARVKEVRVRVGLAGLET